MIKKILVADDSITIQKVIFLTLAGGEYEVTTVGDGTTAIDTLKLGRPDLVVADIVMPGKNGYEVCRFVKNSDSLKGVPVLLLAGAFEGIDEAKAAESGADGHIIKPFESEELKVKVKELLGADHGEAAEARPPGAAPTAQEPAAKKPEAGQESLTETIRKAMAKEAATKEAAAAATAEETTPEENKKPEEAPKTETPPKTEAPKEAPTPVEEPLSASTAVAPETTATTLPGEDEPLTLTQRLRIAMAREAAEKEAAEKEAAALAAGEETIETEENAAPTPEAASVPEIDPAAQSTVARDETAQGNEEPVKAGGETLTHEDDSKAEAPENAPPEYALEPERAPKTEAPEGAVAAPDTSTGDQGKWNADDFVGEELRQEAHTQEGAATEDTGEPEDFDDPFADSFADSFADIPEDETAASKPEEAPEPEEVVEAPPEKTEPEEAEAPVMATPDAPAAEPEEVTEPEEAKAPAIVTQGVPVAEAEEAAKPEEAERPDTTDAPYTNEGLSKEVTNEEFMGLNPSIENAEDTGTTTAEEEEEGGDLGGEDIYGYGTAAAPFESEPEAAAELGKPSDLLGALGGLASLSNLDEPAPTEPHPLEIPFEEEGAPAGDGTTAKPAPEPAAESIEDPPRGGEAEPAAQAAIAAAISREKIEEIVREIAEKVIREVVWEVVPELSEQFIQTEIISKLKAAMSKIE